MQINIAIIIECFDHMETYTKEASIPSFSMKGKEEMLNSLLGYRETI